MGQSHKAQIILADTSRWMRLYARARSYRVQVRGVPKLNKAAFMARKGHGLPEAVMWHDVQVIPRTHQRNDIDYEVTAAKNAFVRRATELQGWIKKFGAERVTEAINATTPSSHDGKGAAQLWHDIGVNLRQPDPFAGDGVFAPGQQRKSLLWTRFGTRRSTASTFAQLQVYRDRFPL